MDSLCSASAAGPRFYLTFMRVATCTPVDFGADAQFFGRDSGLLCRGFQAAGHDACVVMPGSIRPDDEAGVVRCTFQELENESWWRSLGVEMVVLYAWGDPRYRRIAESIRAAGILLVQSLDTAGLHTPWGNFGEWSRCLLGIMASEINPGRITRLAAKALRDFLPALYEKKRLSMIDCSDSVALVSPPAARSVSAYASSLGYPHIHSKILVAPHPVAPNMKPSDEAQLPKVLVVGRWMPEDRAQKDPALTMAVLGKFLEICPEWTAEVVGRGSTTLVAFTGNWSRKTSQRLTLTEAVPRTELIRRYQQSRILLCASRYESYHISSAEAVCCGCSVVVAHHPLLASTGWFTTRHSGALASTRTAHALVKALREEALAWEDGRRDAARIGREWSALLHAHQVAAGIIGGLGKHNAGNIVTPS
jgi:glycosyltransferase involved in cell wall biosynthesis